jgi:hypothetical protein
MAKPERGQRVEFGGLWSAIGYLDLDQQVG